jgi:hypothetical protein
MKQTTLQLSPSLKLPLDAITKTFGILAVRGAGKSNTAAVMAEEMFAAGLPFVVIDPVGSWYGLRSAADGRAPGLPLPIFGGKHGDLPLERSAGALLAELVARQRLSCVLDLSQFESEAAKKAFLLDFAQTLYQRNENPLHLFLEEADDFIPQKPMRDEAKLLRAFENIVRRGRSRGLGVTLITQRSAAINKNVLTQVETLFAMRTTGPQDRAAIEAWIRYHSQGEDVLSTLASLRDGEAWIWSPHWLQKMERVQIRRRRTYDSGATPVNARVGEVQRAATLADIDLEAIRAEMSETLQRVEADDPRRLRQRIKELETQLAKATVPTAPVTQRVEVPVLTQADAETFLQAVHTLQHELAALTAKLIEAMTHLAKPSAATVISELPSTVIHSTILNNRADRTPRSQVLTKAQQAILDSLAWLNSCGIPQPTRQNVAVVTGVSAKGGYYSNTLGALRSGGWIDYPGNGLVTLTKKGSAQASTIAAPRSLRELHARWLEQLPKAQRALLEVLIRFYPQKMFRAALAEQAGLEANGGYFSNNLGALRSLGLVTYPANGYVCASELLFPQGVTD